MVSGHASGEAIIGVTVTFTALAAASTALRLFARLSIVKSGGLDDVFISMAMVFTVVLTITMCLQVNYGMGKHQSSLSSHEDFHALIWFWASVWIYYVALWFAKMAILLQYLRIFLNCTFRKITIGVMVFVTIYGLWSVCSAVWACEPISYFWRQGIVQDAEGKCLNRLAVWFTNAALNILSDIAIAVLPLPLIKSLNLPKSSRVALIVIFSLGGVTCIVSLLRLQALYVVSISNDISWENGQTAIYSNLEVNIGIICCCLPSIRACINCFYPNLFSSGWTASPSDHGHQSTPVIRARTQYTRELDEIKTNTETVVFEGPERSIDDVECSYARSGKGCESRPGDLGGIHVQKVVQQRMSPVPFVRQQTSPSESTWELVRPGSRGQ